MKIDDAIAAIKEFFLEILGFLLPGFTLVLLIYIFLKENFKDAIDIFLSRENSITIALFVSYIIGYILFGISNWWDDIKKNCKPAWLFRLLHRIHAIEKEPYIETIQKNIIDSPEYKLILKAIQETMGFEDEELKTLSVNNVRNIAMSYVPEVDRKIYNFMFRAELSEKVSIALRIIVLFGIFSGLFDLIPNIDVNGVFIFNWSIVGIYLLLILASYFLKQTQKRFLSIAMRIIFPIFLVKYKLEREHKS